MKLGLFLLLPAFLALAGGAGFAQASSPAGAEAPSAPARDDSPLPATATADQAWARIQALEAGPANQSASPTEVLGLLDKLTAAATDFEKRFPNDPRRWDARLIALRCSTEIATAESQQPDPAKMESELKLVAAAPDASKDAKQEARVNLLELHASMSQEETLAPDVEAEMLSFFHDYPDDPNNAIFQKMRLESLEKTDPAKAAKLLDTLLTDPNPAVAGMAQSRARLRDLTRKPFELQFTAVDGTKVDVSKMRGKVVLIDFWASWCAPCMEEVPDLAQTYKDLHAKGLEIVGISLDQDKGPMQGVVASSGMVWPQFYDGNGWQNAIASRYGITAIPRMFLVNKKGMVMDPDVPLPPRAEIEKLLAE